MSNIFRNLFNGNWARTVLGKRDRTYVSEFTGYINHYLEEHPEIEGDQRRGRMLYWEKKVDFSAQEKAEQDKVPEDGYGFYSSAWGRH
jgi:Protein of unknown function (DUF3460)